MGGNIAVIRETKRSLEVQCIMICGHVIIFPSTKIPIWHNYIWFRVPMFNPHTNFVHDVVATKLDLVPGFGSTVIIVDW